jgi:transposase InsO family protein
VVSPSARRRAARHLVEGEKCSVNQACLALKLAKSTYYRKAPTCRPGAQLERRIKALSLKHPRYGYRIVTQLLREEGWQVNRKRVQRVRRQGGLQVVQKRAKTRRFGPTAERRRAQRPNDVWSYDFIHDQLENGGAMKMLTVLDEFTRECLGIWVARSITAVDVIAFLQGLIRQRGAPENMRSDNGPEFVAGVIQQWAEKEAIKINYIAPGSPWENGRVESFHGKFRDGCLNREVFGNLLEAKVLVEDWRRQYNEKRPHSSLGYQTPREFGRQCNSKLRVATLPSALS